MNATQLHLFTDDAGFMRDSMKLETWAEENIGFARAKTGLAEEKREAMQQMKEAFRLRRAA